MSWVLGRGLLRRHLSASQKANVLARAKEYRPPGRPAKGEMAQRCAISPGSYRDLAKQAKISHRMMVFALKVERQAPELSPLVRDGVIDVATAARVADLDADARRH